MESKSLRIIVSEINVFRRGHSIKLCLSDMNSPLISSQSTLVDRHLLALNFDIHRTVVAKNYQ